MFEDEDWNIDEDDLKDFNSCDILDVDKDKVDNSLSAKNVEPEKKSFISLNAFGLKCNVVDSLQSNAISQSNELASQKKTVLDIFKNNSNTQEVLRIGQQNSSVLENEHPSGTNENRKNLILNVFQGSSKKPKPIVKSVLKVSDYENTSKRKKNVAFSDSSSESKLAKKLCTEKPKSQEAKNNDVHIIQKNKDSLHATNSSTTDCNNHKKQPLIDLSKSLLHKIAKIPRVKQAVIRKFPGPAGILPDDVNEEDVIDLDSLDENKNSKSNQYADICSQNTKNLFTTGAWQLMMDDLPADFELYDIATIKENALQYSKTYKKVPYLAGIVQCVDYKPNDPHIILKDLSGKVDARIHHSICKLYPNALGTSIVILAKDVGLIVTSKKFVCVIISLNNLVSIYSDDVRLVETPHLKMLCQNDYASHSLNEFQNSVLNETKSQGNNQVNKTSFQHIQNNLQEQCAPVLKDESCVEKIKEIKVNSIPESEVISDDIDMHEFEFSKDDSWIGVNIDELNSFKPHEFPSSTPLDTYQENPDDSCFQIKSSEAVLAVELKSAPESDKIVSKQPSSMYNKRKNVSDKLLQFRNNKDTIMQQTVSKQLGSSENTPAAVSKPFKQEGSDTDDELLSQLDVDAIAATYNTQKY